MARIKEQKKEYLEVKWNHNFDNEPVFIYIELDNKRNELRKIELYRDGSFGYACDKVEYGGSALSEKAIPFLEKIAEDNQFLPKKLSKEKFESIWRKYVKMKDSKG